MVIKSLTITEEAYDALKSMKLGNESFSKAIVRISQTKRGAAGRFFGVLKGQGSELKKRLKQRRVELEKEVRIRQERLK